jgi:hypothetical protein
MGEPEVEAFLTLVWECVAPSTVRAQSSDAVASLELTRSLNARLVCRQNLNYPTCRGETSCVNSAGTGGSCTALF